MGRERLSLGQARRIALAAQGFGRPKLARAATMRDLQGLIDRLGQFQIDSINVVTRAQFMPAFSRLGAYDPTLLARATHKAPRRLFEYWGHAASLIDVNLQPLLRFRMAEGAHAWGGVERVARENPALIDQVRTAVAERGPISARELEVVEERDRSNWGWNWSAVKTVLEWLFYVGEVTSAYRNSQFERVYDVPERVLPASVVATPTPSVEESVIGLLRRSASALGLGTEVWLRDYFRLRPEQARAGIASLVDAGELIPVIVDGWPAKPVYLWHEARLPRRITTRALLSPFDSMVFERNRLEWLFDFTYRIEIYVPEPQRIYGYYVYPFLLDEALVARVDLKADRARGVLRVNSAWLEPGEDPAYVAVELAAELELMANWLGLAGVEVLPRGDLAEVLRSVNRLR